MRPTNRPRLRRTAPPRLAAPSATTSSGPARWRRRLRLASLSRFNYLTLKADRPRRAAGGALRLVGRVRSGRTRRQRAAVRLPRNTPDSAAPQRHIAHRAHATLKFRNRRLSRVQLAMTIWPNSIACVESGLQTRGRGPVPTTFAVNRHPRYTTTLTKRFDECNRCNSYEYL